MERFKDIERSIIKKFRPVIWRKFVKAISDYELIKDGDKIAVCISGGKDFFLLAKCLEELQRHGNMSFTLEYIIMNPGYKENILKQIKDNLSVLNIKAHIFETPIFDVLKKEKNPCYKCAKMRRGYLYDYARKIGCNKIALGHHFDDVIETILLNLIYNGQYAGMMPKLKSDNFIGMELIRPLYLVKEEDIINWAKYNNLTFIDCACTVTSKSLGKRLEMKEVIKFLNHKFSKADKNILRSLHNTNLNKIITYYDNEKHTFLDEYDK